MWCWWGARWWGDGGGGSVCNATTGDLQRPPDRCEGRGGGVLVGEGGVLGLGFGGGVLVGEGGGAGAGVWGRGGVLMVGCMVVVVVCMRCNHGRPAETAGQV